MRIEKVRKCNCRRLLIAPEGIEMALKRSLVSLFSHF